MSCTWIPRTCTYGHRLPNNVPPAGSVSHAYMARGRSSVFVSYHTIQATIHDASTDALAPVGSKTMAPAPSTWPKLRTRFRQDQSRSIL